MKMKLFVIAVCLFLGPAAWGQGLVSVSPDHGAPGTSLQIEITADLEVYFTHATEVFFSPASGITHGQVEPFENTLTTTIDIPADAPAGMQDVTTLINGIMEYSGQDLFEVIGTSEPEIASVDPASAEAGASHGLVISGVNTHFDSTTTVEFSGSGIQVDGVGSRDSLTLDVNITIAADASRTTRDVTVTTGDEVAAGLGMFTVTAPPVNLSPAAGTQGETITQLTVTGGSGGYDTTTGASLGEGVTVGSVDAPTANSLVLNDVVIATNSPVGPHPLVLFSPDEVFPEAFIVEQGPDTLLLSVTPDHGDRGHPGLEVALVGQNTHFDAGEVRVSLADPNIRETQLNASDAEHLTAVLILADDATEGPVDVSVEIGASSCDNCEKVTLQDGFSVTAPGTLDSADPAAIGAGDGASISITATDGQFVAGQTTLWFEPPDGIEVTSLNVVDSDHLTAEIQTTSDAPGDVRDVRAVTGTEVAVGFGLVDIHNPQILGLTPNTAEPGWDLTVTVFGVDIPFDSASTVSFSGDGIDVSSVSYDSAEPDQISAQISISENAAVGRRDVTVNAQGIEATLLEGFHIQPPFLKPGDGNGGCSCSVSSTKWHGKPRRPGSSQGGGESFGSVLVLMGLLGLGILRRRIKVITPPR